MRRKQIVLKLVIWTSVLTCIVQLSAEAFAKTEIFLVSHKAVMGDNDTKNDVRRMCIREAKRKVLEKAGTYIESRSIVQNFQLTKDEIITYAAALLKVDVVKEEWEPVGENLSVLMTVEVEVDIDDVEQQLSKIQQNTDLQKEIKKQQRQIDEHERKIARLQEELKSTDQVSAFPIRKERNETFKDIEGIEARYAVIMRKFQDRKSTSRQLLKNALSYIKCDMTVEEVENILGPADEKNENDPAILYKGEHGILYFFFNRHEDSVRYLKEISWEPRNCEHIITLKNSNYNILKDGLSGQSRPCERDVREYILNNK